MTRTVVGLLGFAVALTAGCAPTVESDGRGASPVAEHTHPASQSWAMKDGAVTEAEYRSAVSRMVTCVRTAGYKITTPEVSPIDGLTLLYDLEPSGEPRAWSRAVQACDEQHVSSIEPAYVEQHQQVMDPRLRTAVAGCLREKGLRPAGTERNLAAFADLAGGDDQPVTRCVTLQARATFPTLSKTLKLRW